MEAYNMKVNYSKLFAKLKMENITQKAFSENVGIGGTTMAKLRKTYLFARLSFGSTPVYLGEKQRQTTFFNAGMLFPCKTVCKQHPKGCEINRSGRQFFAFCKSLKIKGHFS